MRSSTHTSRRIFLTNWGRLGTWLFRNSPEAADQYLMAKRATVLMVAEAKTRVWEEFGEAVEKCF